MGVPKPVFPPARLLSAAEAEILADQVLARAQGALRQQTVRTQRRQPRAAASFVPHGAWARFECLCVGIALLACLAGCVLSLRI